MEKTKFSDGKNAGNIFYFFNARPRLSGKLTTYSLRLGKYTQTILFLLE